MAFRRICVIGKTGIYVDEVGRMRKTARGRAQHPATILRQLPKSGRRTIRRQLTASGLGFVAAQSVAPSMPTRHGIALHG